jgi:hypothetical protein
VITNFNRGWKYFGQIIIVLTFFFCCCSKYSVLARPVFACIRACVYQLMAIIFYIRVFVRCFLLNNTAVYDMFDDACHGIALLSIEHRGLHVRHIVI